MSKKIKIVCLLLCALATEGTVAQEEPITKNGSAGICAGYLFGLAGLHKTMGNEQKMIEIMSQVDRIRSEYEDSQYTDMFSFVSNQFGEASKTNDLGTLGALANYAAAACPLISVEIPK
jgi:hypothetical protein